MVQVHLEKCGFGVTSSCLCKIVRKTVLHRVGVHERTWPQKLSRTCCRKSLELVRAMVMLCIEGTIPRPGTNRWESSRYSHLYSLHSAHIRFSSGQSRSHGVLGIYTAGVVVMAQENPQIVEKRFVGCSPHKALPMLKRRFRQYHLFERMPDGSVRETKRQLIGIFSNCPPNNLGALF